MNKFFLTLTAICCISISSYASDSCVTVKNNGTYVVGNVTAPAMPERPKGTNGIPQPKSSFKIVK